MSHVTSVRETSETSISLTVSEVSITESSETHIDLEKLKDEIKNIADKQKRKSEYQKYMHLLQTTQHSESKTLSKAERREKQEAQRECKQRKDVKEVRTAQKPSSTKGGPSNRDGKAQTTGHTGNKAASAVGPGKIAPAVNGAIYQCGLWMKAYKIIGSNARVRATLLALKRWLIELAAASTDEKIFSHENFAATNKLLSSQLSYLEDCRKKSIGMGNAIRLLKEFSFRISQERIGESTAYARLAEFTDLFRSEKIDFAVEKIADYGARRIYENDLIATFGHSESIASALRRAAETKRFTVIIIDTPPLFEGRILLRELQGIPNITIRYSLMSSMTASLNDASTVFIGASAVLSNGDVLSRAGTAMVTTVAAHFHIPVVAFGETYKFTQTVWIGSLTNNELHRSSEDGVCSYMYDLTPVRMFDVIMTEYGPLPPCNVCKQVSSKNNLEKDNKNKKEFIVEWDFEVENKGEIAVEAGEIVYLERDKHPDWIKIRRKDNKAGYIPRAYAKPYMGGTEGKSISLIVELARDPQNIKELIVDSKISFEGLKESIGHSFGALVSDLASVAGSSIVCVSQLRPYDRVVVRLGSDQGKGGNDENWQSQSDKKVLADDIIASALLDQRAPSRNWYRNQQKTNTDQVKGMLRVFLPDDPALDKFGLRSSVFTIRYFGITMRAAHLKAAVKEQMCSKCRIKDELLDYTKRFVIVEVKPDSHRVVSRREPLGKWEKENCPANTRLMYVPILSHFNFKVNYHASQVKVNTWFHVRLHVTDPIHLDRSVDQMEADLAVWVRNSLGTESEYEMVQDHEKRGCFIAKLRFATAGRYRACVKFDGFAIQSKNTSIHVHTSGFGNKFLQVIQGVPHISSGGKKGGKEEKTPELSSHGFFDSPKSEPRDKKEKKKDRDSKKNRKSQRLFG